jgi:hypothetical protein
MGFPNTNFSDILSSPKIDFWWQAPWSKISKLRNFQDLSLDWQFTYRTIQVNYYMIARIDAAVGKDAHAVELRPRHIALSPEQAHRPELTPPFDLHYCQQVSANWMCKSAAPVKIHCWTSELQL